jgi:CSLREA domain-containing protein
MNARPSRTRIWIAGILALALILGILPAPVAAHPLADAAPIVVDTTADSLAVDGLCSLREAITAANTRAMVDMCGAAGGFEAIILPAGTYALAIPGASEDENATGDLDIKASVTIEGAGAETTVIDGSQLDRVLHIHADTTAALANLSIQNGLAPYGRAADSRPGENGGGILNLGALTLTSCDVRHNKAGDGGNGPFYDIGTDGGGGGGIYNSGPLLVLDESEVADNLTGDGGLTISSKLWPAGHGGPGGGICSVAGNVILRASRIINNRTGYGGLSTNFSHHFYEAGGCGGGLYSSGDLFLVESEVSGNSTANSGSGGGLYMRGEERIIQATIVSSIVTGNRAGSGYDEFCSESEVGYPRDGGSGGGIWIKNGDVEIVQTVISDNAPGSRGVSSGCDPPLQGEDGSGGGVYNAASLRVTNTTISGNTAGGIRNTNTVRMSHSTVADNRDYGVSSDGGFMLRNTILTGSRLDPGDAACVGALDSAGYNLIGSIANCTVGGDSTGNLLDVDPLLGLLGDNGGPTGTQSPVPGSPAIEAGTCTDLDGAPVAVDQRKMPRPGGMACDIGAYEVQDPSSVRTWFLPVFSNDPLEPARDR